MKGAPGRTSWARMQPNIDSTLPWTTVPARVAGAVAPAWGPE